MCGDRGKRMIEAAEMRTFKILSWICTITLKRKILNYLKI